MNHNKSLLALLAVGILEALIIAGPAPRPVAADGGPYVDQANDAFDPFGTCYALPAELPSGSGQEFVPDLPGMDAVELPFYEGAGAQLKVRIRQGSVDGAVLGDSEVTTVPTKGGPERWVGFGFPSRLSLTPGQKYVLQLMVVDMAGASGSLCMDPVVPGAYPGGNAVWNGEAQPWDWAFREGLTLDVPLTASGAGVVSLPGSGLPATFGFMVKFSVDNWQADGVLTLMRQTGRGLHWFSADRLGSLIGGKVAALRWARLTGSGKYWKPGWLGPRNGYTFEAYLEDGGRPGVADRLWIAVRDPAGRAVDALSMAAPGGANAVALPPSGVALTFQ